MKKKIVLIIVGLLLIFNVFAWQEVFVLYDRNLEVIFLDVGQGDSVFIKTPQGHQIIIDGGPDPSVLSKVSSLMPFWDRTIDLVILTHPDKDHMQGLIEILKRYKINYILHTGAKKDSAEHEVWQEVLEKQKDMGARIIIAEAGQNIKVGEVLIYTLYPLENMNNISIDRNTNESSIVSKIVYGNNSFLFTGDIYSKVEKEIVNSGQDLFSDVLKVAHHGSKYSTSDLFLENVQPRLAVISVGKNSYGHPTVEVLQKLEKFGITVLRTDINGDVRLISDGSQISIK